MTRRVLSIFLIALAAGLLPCGCKKESPAPAPEATPGAEKKADQGSATANPK